MDEIEKALAELVSADEALIIEMVGLTKWEAVSEDKRNYLMEVMRKSLTERVDGSARDAAEWFLEAVFAGVSGNVAYDILKQQVTTIKVRRSGASSSAREIIEDAARAAIQIRCKQLGLRVPEAAELRCTSFDVVETGFLVFNGRGRLKAKVSVTMTKIGPPHFNVTLTCVNEEDISSEIAARIQSEFPEMRSLADLDRMADTAALRQLMASSPQAIETILRYVSEQGHAGPLLNPSFDGGSPLSCAQCGTKWPCRPLLNVIESIRQGGGSA